MRSRSFRRHQIDSHLHRRLSEDRNRHYRDLSCPCWHDARAMARFKEQPQRCSGSCCCNPRRNRIYGTDKDRLTLHERRFLT